MSLALDTPSAEPPRALRQTIETATPALLSLSEASASRPRGPGQWTRKQILGHLLDSAINNHRRFVLAQTSDSTLFDGYDQVAWVALQRYDDRSWRELVELWAGLNAHLARVMDAMSPVRLGRTYEVPGGTRGTLQWWLGDYVRHCRHHLGQILAGDEDPPQASA